ncbi:class I SAM-dependent methyltransferase [Spirillospora sp. NPDC049652]
MSEAGSRDDPHAQPRAAREPSLLLHSMALFRELFEIVYAVRTIGAVVEVGVESGRTSSLYADLGASAVYCVEPRPTDGLRAAFAADPRLTLVEDRSPGALGQVPSADLYVLDGDHNYAVVRAELAWIMANAPDAVVVLHDVLWPGGRRDMYYQPSPLAPGERHPDTADGPSVWTDELGPAGFVGAGDFTWAEHAGGERNGVLTAVEDAVAEAADDWRFEIVPAVFGFGVLARAAAEGTGDLFEALRPYTSSRLLAAMENNRIALYTHVLGLQHLLSLQQAESDEPAQDEPAQDEPAQDEPAQDEPGHVTSEQDEPDDRPSSSTADETPVQEAQPRRTGVFDYIGEVAMHQPTWGTFLVPDGALAEADRPHELLGIPIQSGFHADLSVFAGQNTVFDRIADRVASVKLDYEDQCSPKHYFDVFTRIEREHAHLTRIVDVGTFMGGSAAVFAGCVEPMGLELDIVDVNDAYLRFAHERVRRAFPGAVPRVRIFHGDLPTYVRTVLLAEQGTRALVHHDAAHSFDQVVKDLSALYFARDRVHSLAVQDTHLRGSIGYLNFVDAAVYAIYGKGVEFEPLGAAYPAGSAVCEPNQWDGNYFMAEEPEGMYLRFEGLTWKYPHPSMTLDEFMPVPAATTRPAGASGR